MVKFQFCHLVKGLKISNWWGNSSKIGEFVLQVSDEHSKLGSPVTNVVHPGDIMTEIFQQSTDTLSNNR